MGDKMKKIFNAVFSISFMFYLLALISLLFLGSRGYWTDVSLIEYIKSSSNFVPFKTINLYVHAIFDGSMNRDTPIKNLFGNFVMFLPMGIYLPYFIKRMNKVSVFSISMMISLLVIEIVQVAAKRGSFDIDDFILNMSGALIGYFIWKSKVVQTLFTQNSKNSLSA
ncbi:VanZ family protein [Metabacillus indicus]|uniref:VanZ family protein n=1 Tax=Metabacillus indicus TaxID=246786 RepID=UPI001F389930|nr:VanZ family protein [Metabacillus indicus]